MKVLKFGGTSVGSAQRMKEVAKLITDGERKLSLIHIYDCTAAVTDYIHPFSAALHKDNYYATQFHPEKSGSCLLYTSRCV